MPELPEVETVKNALKAKVKNRIIKNVSVYYDNIIEYPVVSVFKEKLVNQKINDIDRYWKWLIFVLYDYYLLSHLRMEGKYFFRKKDEDIYLHEHVSFLLDNDVELRYMDVRKFGKMWLIKKEDISKVGPLKDLGLEPWDKKLDVVYLKKIYSKKKLPIKTVLLDQNIIVGIGNIYADEILFLSKVNPMTKCNLLDDSDLLSIINNTRIVLESAIKKGGSTIKSYSSVNGVHGLFQQELKVHCRNNEKCYNCGNEIIKIKIGGRGTYYCSNCQIEKI